MLRQFFEYYRPWKALFFLDFGCAVLSGLLELAFPLAIKGFIDVLLPSGNLALTLWAAVGLLVIYLVNAGLMVIVIYWGHKLGINIETEMRRRAFAHLQRLSFGYFDKVRTGKLVARVTRDLEEIGEVAHHGPEDLFIAVMTFAGAFILMATINLELALITARTAFPPRVVHTPGIAHKLADSLSRMHDPGHKGDALQHPAIADASRDEVPARPRAWYRALDAPVRSSR